MRQAWASHRQVKDDSIVAEECLQAPNVFAKNMPLFAMRGWLQSAHRTLRCLVKSGVSLEYVSGMHRWDEQHLHENCMVHIVPGVNVPQVEVVLRI